MLFCSCDLGLDPMTFIYKLDEYHLMVYLQTKNKLGSSPSYLSGLVTAIANIQFRKRLLSADTNRYEPLTTRLKFSERCFSHAGPKAWNALPAELQDLTDHSAFRRQLKTSLFERAFTT